MKILVKCNYCDSEEFERGNRKQILCSQCGELIECTEDLTLTLDEE